MPTTRSGASTTTILPGADAQPPDTNSDDSVKPLTLSLADLDDSAVVQGRDAKLLRDATAMAIAQVWNDTRATTSQLAKKINEGNSSLTEKLNESFVAVGNRLDSLPMVAMLGQDTQSPKPIRGCSSRSGYAASKI
ncbi:hypothetical protein ANCCAN_11148 [Ancylostoma caninum]|uniref:Uncharacterized protein n=1 Tax=Ancylostoma caninum TaxID=29170 RepID=A0A368GER6_ANCCA|nr:hypothetical protein ANCCAN_11148 [Ancylostoma caninum]